MSEQSERPPKERRPRRRVQRRSTAENYDRSADRPSGSFFGESSSVDGDRQVILDDDAPVENLSREQEWQEERPPHYGG